MAKKTQNKRKPRKKTAKKNDKNDDKDTSDDSQSSSILETLSRISPMFSTESVEEEEMEEPLDKTCHIDLAIGTKGDKTYEKARKEGMPTFVRVHARWCGHCQELEPVWNELKDWHEKNVKNKKSPLESILLLSVEDTELERAKEKYPELHADGYPSLMMVRNGRVQNQFQGPRSLPSLKTFVENQARDMRPRRYRGGSKKSRRRHTRRRRKSKAKTRPHRRAKKSRRSIRRSRRRR